MPVPKLKASSTPDVMKSEDGKDSLDTIIRQAIGKEPFLSFSRAGESPVQWIQLLHALDQQELPGWPLLSPLKVQLQKCDKCSREFCSPINYRRHIRVHHRLKKLDKDSTKNRDLLGAYWDKLSSEEAKEVVSFNNVMLEDVPGSSIIKSLTTLIRKLGFSSLPQYYLKAGSTLLDIVQARSRFPITSQELFSVLDDASEKTFLCGPAMSMQKYVFDGEAGKIGLEPKNLIACTSFLLEQNLIMAWLADKDAEALKCQKLLMEEEEAAQKRQAEILEKKRQKKLRQKEQKGKEQRHEANLEMKESISSALEVVSPEETSLGRCDFEVLNGETFADYIPYSLAPFQCPNTDDIVEDELQSGYGCGCTDSNTDQNIERQTAQVHNRRRITAVQRQVLPRQQWAVANGFHASHSSHIPKLGVIQKHGTHRDQKAAPIINGNKVWSIKSKPETDGVILKDRLQKETDPVKSHEILIGSISVSLGNCSQSEGNMVSSQEDCTEENLSKQNSDHEQLIKVDTIQSGNNRPTVKLWRPVSRQGSEDSPVPVQNVSREVDMDAIDGKGDDQNSLDHSCLRLCDVDNSDSGLGSSHSEDNLGPGSLRLSSHAAKAFLAQRWKEAISSDHVKLVLSTDSEPPGSHEILEFEQAACHSSNDEGHSILRSTENRLVNKDLESATSGAAKSRLRMKPEKGVKIKYIPKQKTATQ